MLKKIPAIISPELMKIMMEMGHGDEIVLADGNFPASSKTKRLVRCDGCTVAELLEAILPFFPLDRYVEAPVGLMAVVAGDTVVPIVWEDYKEIITKHEAQGDQIDYMERAAFYERAEQAYAIVATTDHALYANLILKKGVVVDP